MNIGRQIKLARKRKGMTIHELAGDDYTKSHISKIENNKTQPSYETLQNISAKLGVQVSAFFDEADHEWTKNAIETVYSHLNTLKIPHRTFEDIYTNMNKLTYTKESIKVLYLLLNHCTLTNEPSKVKEVQEKIDYIIFYIDDKRVTLECKILSGNLFFSDRKYNEAFHFYNEMGKSYSAQLERYTDLNQLFLLQYLVAVINIGDEELFFSIYKKIYDQSLQTENFSKFTRATIILLSYYKLTQQERKYHEYRKELSYLYQWIPKPEYQVELILSYGTEPFRNQTLRNLERYKEVISILENDKQLEAYLRLIRVEYDYIHKDYQKVIDTFSDFLIPDELMYCVVDRVSLFQRSLILPFSHLAMGNKKKAKVTFNHLLEEVKDIKSHPILQALLMECSFLNDG